MPEISYDIETFFAQLGLPNDRVSITHFLTAHHLVPGTIISNAAFWTPAQAALIAQALAEDAAWAIVADQIATLLSQTSQ